MFKGKVFLLVLFVVFLVVSLTGQSIIVTDPGSGDGLCINAGVEIRWTKSGEMHNRVKIRLFDRSGTKILDIINNTPNSGTFTWNRIPVSVQSGSYVIRVKTLDNLVWDDSDVFVMRDCSSDPRPDIFDDPDEERIGNTISIKTPRSRDVLLHNSITRITWILTGEMSRRVNIRLFDWPGNTRILNITENTSNSGLFIWEGIPSNIARGKYKIKIKTLDNLVSGDSDVFIISGNNDGPDEDTNRNNLNIRQPRENERWSYESTHRVSWNGLSRGNVKLELIQNGVVKGLIYSGSDNGSLQWLIKNYTNGNPIQTGNYKMRITHLSDTTIKDDVNITLVPKNLFYDFVIDSLKKNDNDKLTARVKNIGNKDYSGPVRFRIWENEQRINSDRIFMTMNIRAHSLSNEIVFLNHSISRNSCGTHVQLMVNPPDPGRINESDYRNNSMMKQLFFTMYNVKLLKHLVIGNSRSYTFRDNIPTIVVNPGMASSIVKKRPRGSGVSVDYLEVTVPVKVHLRNCGYATTIRDVWIKIEKVLIGDEYSILYHRKPHQMQPGKIMELTLYPKFKVIPVNNRMRIKFSGGFRQSGGDMSFRQTGGRFQVIFVFNGFESHY